MSKARTLADFISDGSEFADGTISVAEVSGAAPLASPSFTGNVGIGVTPATFYGRALHVHDTGTAGANIRLTDSNSGTTGNDGMDILQINNTSYIINREAGGMNFYTGGQLRYTIQGDGTHVFNENSLDSDFRVESDGYANMLFVDAGNNRVGIASGSPDQSLDIAVGGLQIKGNIAAPASGTSAMQVDYYSGGARYWSRGATLGVRGTHKFYTLTNTSGSQITPLIIETTGGVTLNEDSADADFRVESDSNTHMLFVDAGNDFVGINKSSPEVVLHVRSTSAGAMTTFESSSANSSGGPNIRLWRNSASPADGDGLARLVFQGNNDAAERIDYAEIQTEIIDASDGTEDGLFQIETVVDGVSRNRLRLNGTESIFNDGGRALDFRVESDSNTHVLFVQGSGSGAVGINNNAPSYNLDVSGSTRTTQMVPSYSSITGTSSSANWWKLGTISNLAGSRSLKIRIQGTYSYSAGGQISGESTILFRGNNATTTIQGTFWSETEGLSHLSGVAWKNTGTGDQFDIWVNWASTFAGMDIFIESAAQWEYDISDTGSETVPSGATQISAIWNMFSGTSKTFSSYSTEAVINNDGSGGIDFRVESDANTHCFFVNAAENQVTMGNTSDALASRALFIKNNQYPQQNYATHASINYPTLQLRTAYATGGQTATQVDFRNGADGLVGTIKSTVNVTSYNTSSDQRLKENIVNAPSASDDIDAIQVRSFDWRANGLHQKYGMVAQELLTVAPDAVAQGDTEEDMMGVDYSKLVPMLIKEIQSLRARVAQLENA